MVTTLPPIRVYNSNERTFANNGLRCLTPSIAEVTMQHNQAPSLSLTHPLDDFGNWQSLALGRVLYVPIMRRNEITYQPFRINKMTKQRQTDGQAAVTVEALHVFYDLNGCLLPDVRPTNANGQAALQSIFTGILRPNSGTQAADVFSYSSNITTLSTAYYDYKSLTSALIGEDNCFLNRWGGELYVDKFRISINSRMEGAQDNAFHAVYGVNMSGVTAEYSTENTYNALIATSNISTTPISNSVSAASLDLPYDKSMYATFSYSEEGTQAQFQADFSAYFNDLKKITASYQVIVADLQNTDEYAGFSGIESYEVGDTGTVYDESLGIDTVQKIVGKVIDVINQQTISITLGSTPASITRPKQYANTVSTSQNAAQKSQTVNVQKLQSQITEQSQTLQQQQDEIDALKYPKQTVKGEPPLTFTAMTNSPAETWKLSGNDDGVGDSDGMQYAIPLSINGILSTTVYLDRKLFAGDYIQRTDGGYSYAHYVTDEYGEPIETPYEEEIDMNYITISKGTNTVTIGTTIQPTEIEIIYK